jgi:hypothetical protein
MPAALGFAIAAVTAPPSGLRHPAGAAEAAATALAVDGCIQVDLGETVEVEIRVSDVTDLLAWDIYYAYNKEVLTVTGRDVRRFLEGQLNSNVFDLSDPLPNSIGLYRLGAADTGGAGAAETGGGVLAVLTLEPKRKGISWSSLYRSDADGNGTIDIGPTLTALGGNFISDLDGDGIFDGSLVSGQVAVGTKCLASAPTPTLGAGVVITPPTSTATRQPSTPTESPTPDLNTSTSPAATTEPASRTPDRPTSTTTPPDRRNAGGALSNWLLSALAGSATVGVLLTYAIFRTRRPR